MNNVTHDEDVTPTWGQQNPFGPPTQATQYDGSQPGTSISINTSATEASHTVSRLFQVVLTRLKAPCSPYSSFLK